MTADSLRFNGVLAGSIFLHALFFLFVFALPGGTPDPDLVRVYHVNVVEAPARPKVRQLELSTQPISELKLEAPSLKLETPPETAVPAAERPPAAPPAPPPAVPSPAAVAPAQIQTKATPPAPAATLPKLPAAPKERQPAPPAPPSTREEAAPPPLPPAAPEPQRRSAIERVRQKVDRLNLEFEKTVIHKAGESAPGQRMAKSPISLRRYLNTVQEAITENYKFPGGFDKNLWVRVRLTIQRDGTITKTEILESSGNERFDYAARIALRRAKLPPIPDGIEGDSITQVIKFTP